MRWYEAKLYRRVQTGTDATRKPTYALAEDSEAVVLVRTAPESPRRGEVEGNQFDVRERTFVTRAERAALDGVAAVEVQGTLYDVRGLSSWDGRAVAIHATRCK